MILDNFRLRLALDEMSLDQDVKETIEQGIVEGEENLNALIDARVDIMELEEAVNELKIKLEKARQFYREVRAEWKGPWPDKWIAKNPSA